MREAIITSSVLIIGILLLRRGMRGKISARLQYALWLLVAFRLILPGAAAIFPNADIIPKSDFSVMNMAEKIDTAMGTYLAETNDFASKELPSAGLPLRNETLSNEGLNIVDTFRMLIEGLQSGTWDNVLHKIWYIGIAAAALWMIGVNLLFTRHLHRSRKPYKIEQQKLPVYLVNQLDSPCLYGFLEKQAIYLTKDIAEDEKKCRHVLVHEYCHVKHGDMFWSLLRCVLLAVYWFHPLVWLAAILSQRDCELACDEAAIQKLGEDERISYGRTLVALAERETRVSNIFCTAASAAEGKKGITERIQQIAHQPKMLMATVLFVAVIVGIVVTVTFTGSNVSTKMSVKDTVANLTYDSRVPTDGTVSTDSLQIIFPKELADKITYTIENKTDILMYDKQSKQEIGRFCVMPWEEAMALVGKRKIVTLGEYGSNQIIDAYIKGEITQHAYIKGEITQHAYISSDDMSAHKEDTESSEHAHTRNETGVKGTDSNAAFNLDNDINVQFEEKTDYIPAQTGENITREHTYIPNETNPAAGTNAYVNNDTPNTSNIQYLPDEEIVETRISVLEAPQCYLYVSADYSGMDTTMQQNLEAMDRELAALADNITILAVSAQSMETPLVPNK